MSAGEVVGAGSRTSGLRLGSRHEKVRFTVDGRQAIAFAGETVAAALLVLGHRTLRRSWRRNEPRGIYCGVGTCAECRVTIDGQPNVRACVTTVREGVSVELGKPER